MNTILEWYDTFLKLSQNNPAVAGFVGLYIAGITGWILKDFPTRIKNFIIRECFTTLQIVERGETWSDFDEKIQFKNFFSWVIKYNLVNLSRYFNINKLNSIWELVPGIGTNFFIYNRRLFWYTRTVINGSGQSNYGIKYEVNITTYGRNIKVLEEIFQQFKEVHLENDNKNIFIRQVDGSDWWDIQEVPKKDINNIFINKESKAELFETFELFNKQMEICKKLQTPYRLTLLLEGPTGTGKTTIIKALANYLNKNIYVMSPTDLLKSNLSRNLAKWGKDGIVVIEDIDSLSSIKSRGDFVDEDIKYTENIGGHQEVRLEESSSKGLLTKSAKNKKSESNISELYDLFGGGLSSVLNNLDGIIEYHGSIIIMTTNDASSIDKAMLRPGRIDKIIHIGWLSKETIIENICKFYYLDDSWYKILNDRIQVNKLSGAKLSNIFKFSTDADDVIKKINSNI